MSNQSCIKSYLFDPQLLKGLSSLESSLEPRFILRPLRDDDYSKGFLQLLSQLTKVGDIDYGAFKSKVSNTNFVLMNLILLCSLDQFEKMKDAKTYFVIVIEDTDNETIVAATTLFLEYKFIHGAGLRGRIEDVVVSQSHRGQKLGKVVVDTGVELSRKLNCYKLSLDCRDELLPFYQSLGFKAEKGRANMLVQRFSD